MRRLVDHRQGTSCHFSGDEQGDRGSLVERELSPQRVVHDNWHGKLCGFDNRNDCAAPPLIRRRCQSERYANEIQDEEIPRVGQKEGVTQRRLKALWPASAPGGEAKSLILGKSVASASRFSFIPSESVPTRNARGTLATPLGPLPQRPRLPLSRERPLMHLPLRGDFPPGPLLSPPFLFFLFLFPLSPCIRAYAYFGSSAALPRLSGRPVGTFRTSVAVYLSCRCAPALGRRGRSQSTGARQSVILTRSRAGALASHPIRMPAGPMPMRSQHS
jgi:hypothetical protein